MESAGRPPKPALAGWSLHRRFRRRANPLSLLDFPRVAREEFGIGAVELNSPFFEYENASSPGTNPVCPEFVERLRGSACEAGVRILSIAVDHHGDLSSPDQEARRAAVEQHTKWIGICEQLGCASFRANSGAKDIGPIGDAHVEACAKSFGELARRSGRAGICVLMENHWGLSEDPRRMVRVMEMVNDPHCGVLADFRNWPEGQDPYAALAMIAPFAKSVHAKFLSFDANGDDPNFDTPRALGVLRRAGFAGPMAIEFEGEMEDHQGVLLSKALLNRLL